MSNYTRSTNFTAKDALASGNPSKIILGSEHDAEYDAIATAIATKLDSNGSAASLTALPAAQGGSLVLLNRVAASGASSVSWNATYITSTYERYFVVINDLSHSTTADLWAQFSSDNGSTWIGSTSNVHARWGALSSSNGLNSLINASTGDSKVVFGTGFTSAYKTHISLNLDMGSVASVYGMMAFFSSGISQGSLHVWGATNTSCNAFRILPSTGTISGNLSLYGIKKS